MRSGLGRGSCGPRTWRRGDLPCEGLHARIPRAGPPRRLPQLITAGPWLQTTRGRTGPVRPTDPGRGRANPASARGRRRGPCCPLVGAAASAPAAACAPCGERGSPVRRGSGDPENLPRSARPLRARCPPEASSGPLFLVPDSRSWPSFQGYPQEPPPNTGPLVSPLPIVAFLSVQVTWEPGYGCGPGCAAIAPGGPGLRRLPIPRFPRSCRRCWPERWASRYLHPDGAFASLWDRMQVPPLQRPPQWRALRALHCGLSFGDPWGRAWSVLAMVTVGGSVL